MKIINKKAKFNYNLFETIEAGIALIGSEAKALRTTGGNISDAYARFIGNELFLVNANIPIKGKKDYSPTRSRKLLLHRKELESVQSKIKAKKLTLVPIKLYNRGRLVKLELALAKSKRKFEKKDSIKKKDIEREMERELRGDKE